jgi:peptide/nickel transport system substrate-binding protein
MRTSLCLAISVLVMLSLMMGCSPGAPTVVPTKPSAPAATTVSSAPTTVAAAPTAAPAAATKPAAPAVTAAPVAKIKRGGTLIRADIVDPDTWDPAFSSKSKPTAENPALEAPIKWALVDASGKHEPKPWLAESWQIVEPKTVVLKLRQGVKFHDGSDFNADVAKWQLDRDRMHPKSKGKAFQAAINSIDIKDPYTLQLNLKAPSAVILVNLTNAAGGAGSPGTLMISKAYWDQVGDEGVALKLVGTGPFMLADFQRDSRTTYKKYDQYWKMGDDGQKLPYLDAIGVRIVRDVSVGLIEVKSGNVHLIEDIDAKDITGVKSNPELVINEMPWASVRHRAGVMFEKNPWGTNVKLRQAAQYAIDRDAVARTLGLGNAQPDYFNTWVPGFPGYDEKNPKYEFNLNKANQLKTEAGFSGDVPMSIVAMIGIGQRHAEILQSMWAKVGIRTTITALDSLAVSQASETNDFDFTLSNGQPGSPDPDGMSRFFICGGTGNGGRYCNPALDKCFEQGAATYDFKERDGIYKRCQQILYEDAQNFSTFMQSANVVSRKEVKNLQITQHISDMREVWLEK